jgi:peptide deformylase
MHAGNLIGMAAPQIGENYQIYVTHPRETDARPRD